MAISISAHSIGKACRLFTDYGMHPYRHSSCGQLFIRSRSIGSEAESEKMKNEKPVWGWSPNVFFI
ncbi:hypothetical protein, partial [uncultured Porphyromonas sp.]|uniref:hypothetical protein n=1 Tax=uncultured Porphyromonas sp. TaxID=159274 RepID=UPI002805D1E2